MLGLVQVRGELGVPAGAVIHLAIRPARGQGHGDGLAGVRVHDVGGRPATGHGLLAEVRQVRRRQYGGRFVPGRAGRQHDDLGCGLVLAARGQTAGRDAGLTWSRHGQQHPPCRAGGKWHLSSLGTTARSGTSGPLLPSHNQSLMQSSSLTGFGYFDQTLELGYGFRVSSVNGPPVPGSSMALRATIR